MKVWLRNLIRDMVLSEIVLSFIVIFGFIAWGIWMFAYGANVVFQWAYSLIVYGTI